MNFRELNYLVLSSIREQLHHDFLKTAHLFNMPVQEARQLRAVSDADLRKMCAVVPAPVMQIPLLTGWLTALSTADSEITIGWEDLLRYRAAILEGGAYVA